MSTTTNNVTNNGNKNQVVLSWDYMDKENFVHKNSMSCSYEAALAFCEQLKSSPDVTNVFITNGEEKFVTVVCVFSNSTKQYTYLCKKPVKAGSSVLVDTTYGLKIVKAIRSEIKTRSELTKIMPMCNYRYIVGTVYLDKEV